MLTLVPRLLLLGLLYPPCVYPATAEDALLVQYVLQKLLFGDAESPASWTVFTKNYNLLIATHFMVPDVTVCQ